MTTEDEVTTYLLGVRALIANRRVVLIGRPKNLDALVALQMSKEAAVQDVRTLTAKHYCAGPEDDKDRGGQACWVFGRVIAQSEVYIKLVIEQVSADRQRLKILSFHQAERPLRYRFR